MTAVDQIQTVGNGTHWFEGYPTQVRPYRMYRIQYNQPSARHVAPARRAANISPHIPHIPTRTTIFLP